MTNLEKQVQVIFKGYGGEPATALKKIEDLLLPAFDVGGECDPLTAVENNEIWDGVRAYQFASQFFRERGHVAAAEVLLLQWWNKLAFRQYSEGVWIYKAVVALSLANHYITLKDMGAALKWSLLTHADDMLKKGHSGIGLDYLITIFGLSQSILDVIAEHAKQCREEVRILDDDWSLPQGFPEEVLCRIIKSEKASFLFNQAVEARQFPLSVAYFEALLNRVRSTSNGDSLEDLVLYLVSLLPGCVPRPKVLARQQTGESDIVVHNFDHKNSLTSEVFGRHFIIECKNWNAKRVGVAQVGYFLYRMRLLRSGFGIIFIAADSLLTRAFHEDGTVCINITLDDMELLVKQDKTLWWMLLEKIEELRFGIPRLT